MLFKYFVEFDDNGGIKNLYRSKKDCKDCKEYLVKLIPIDRELEMFDQKVFQLDKAMDKMIQDSKKLDTEFNKMVRDLKRVR